MGIFSPSLFSLPSIPDKTALLTTILLLVGFIIVEWNGRTRQFAIENLGQGWKRPYRWATYIGISFAIIYLGAFDEGHFIYFQF